MINSHHGSPVSILLHSREAIKERSPNVVKSPREAAMGVATLSGFIDTRRESRITATMTRPKTKVWSCVGLDVWDRGRDGREGKRKEGAEEKGGGRAEKRQKKSTDKLKTNEFLSVKMAAF